MYPLQFAREMTRYAKVRYLRARRFETPSLDVDYFLYPMQFHPESSTSINSVHFLDEVSNVRNISIALRPGMKLYVKDHPHAAARARLAMYEDIAKFPNVVLVDPMVDGQTLVRHARAVVTCTSSMGYEAIVLGVPVFTLGETMWHFFPGNVNLRSFEHAADAFSSYDKVVATKEEREAFVASYFLSSFEGVFDLEQQWRDAGYATQISPKFQPDCTLIAPCA